MISLQGMADESLFWINSYIVLFFRSFIIIPYYCELSLQCLQKVLQWVYLLALLYKVRTVWKLDVNKIYDFLSKWVRFIVVVGLFTYDLHYIIYLSIVNVII